MGRRERIYINFEIRQDSIDKSIKSLMRFVDLVKSEIDEFRKEFESVYNEYLTSVENNQMKLSISYSSFRKADGIYSKIISALKKFIALLITDYADILSVANKLTTANKKYFKIQQQIIDNKRNDLSQLEQSIKNMKNIIQNFNELANEYHSKLMVFQSLQRNLQDRMIVYTSFNGNQFRLLVKSELEEFRDLLELDDSSSLRGKINSLFVMKSARQLESIGDKNLLQPIKSLKIIESTENDNTEDQQSTAPQKGRKRNLNDEPPTDDNRPASKKLKMTALLTSIMSITADDLKSQNVINFGYFSNDEIDNSLAKGKVLWRNWVDLSFNHFVNREGFNDFINNYSYLLPITNNSSENIRVINKIFNDVMEMERKFVENRTDIESLDDILNLKSTDSEVMKEQYKYLRKKVIIHELNYYFIYDAISHLCDKFVDKDVQDKIEELEELKLDICKCKIAGFMEERLLREIKRTLTKNRFFKDDKREFLRYTYKENLNEAYSNIVNTKIDISMISFEKSKSSVSPDMKQLLEFQLDSKKKELDRLIKLKDERRNAYYSRYLEKS